MRAFWPQLIVSMRSLISAHFGFSWKQSAYDLISANRTNSPRSLKIIETISSGKEVSKMLLSQKFCVKKFTYMRMAPVTKESPPTKRLMNPPIRAQSPPRRPRYPAATGIQGEYRELIGSESSYGGGLSWLGTGVTTALSSIGTVLSIVWIVSNSHNVKKTGGAIWLHPRSQGVNCVQTELNTADKF